ncbi:MAG: hypothetical protein FVQ83_17140 [Chloroflexi bacterium]|nr:hypothetical protein [Chloroflexota bacterium]
MVFILGAIAAPVFSSGTDSYPYRPSEELLFIQPIEAIPSNYSMARNLVTPTPSGSTRLLPNLMATPVVYPFGGEILIDAEGRRTSQFLVDADSFYWMLLTWDDNELVCQVYVDHEGLPTPTEIYYACGEDTFDDWQETTACSANPSSCQGLYLHFVGRETRQVMTYADVPNATVSAEVLNCTVGDWCPNRAEMRFTAFEPLPNHVILEVRIRIGDEEFVCHQLSCKVLMPITDEQGLMVEYWAASSLGDESAHETFRLRNLPSDSIGTTFRLDLLGEMWEDSLPGCSLEWDSLPTRADLEEHWLEEPLTTEYLTTTNRYALLAGNLIWSGEVDASSCSNNGLLPNGAADTCGERTAAEEVLEWQNRYDRDIFSTGNLVNVPLHLLKAVIAQESQFWPQSDVTQEYGLGRVTDYGLDMLLLWNPDYFNQVCPRALGRDSCAAGYASLSAENQAMLRGMTYNSIGTPNEITLLGEMLQASCSQTGQMVSNQTDGTPGEYVAYEDLWALSLATYHSGAGCIGVAIEAAWEADEEMTWEQISSYLVGDCQSAEEYVRRVFWLAR